MKRFDKTKSIEHNYYPIYANNLNNTLESLTLEDKQ